MKYPTREYVGAVFDVLGIWAPSIAFALLLFVPIIGGK